jgi:fucose 4-O-acetylase-like acetyltransferase
MTVLINLLFFLIVATTVLFAVWLSRKFKERFAEFPWTKAGIIIAVEVVAWIITASLWSWVSHHPWIAVIAVAIIVIVLFSRKKREDQIL